MLLAFSQNIPCTNDENYRLMSITNQIETCLISTLILFHIVTASSVWSTADVCFALWRGSAASKRIALGIFALRRNLLLAFFLRDCLEVNVCSDILFRSS